MNSLFNSQRNPYSSDRSLSKDERRNRIVTKRIVYNRHGEVRKVIEYERSAISKPTREEKP